MFDARLSPGRYGSRSRVRPVPGDKALL